MCVAIGQVYEQIKELNGFPYNAVGQVWVVHNIDGKYTVLKNAGVGLGVDDDELKECFRYKKERLFDFSNIDNSCDEDEYDVDDVMKQENVKENIISVILRKLGLK